MPNNSTHIVRFYTPGGPLTLETMPTPEPAVGEVRVAVKAIGLNRVEDLFWQGQYFTKPILPSKLGLEGSGIVEAIGDGVDPFWIVKRVSMMPNFDMTVYGVAGERAIVPETSLVDLPEATSFEQGAAVWMAYLTAYGAVVRDGKVDRGDFVIVNAASSSNGLALLQMVKSLGASSIAVSRTDKKKQPLLDLGADYFVPSDAPDFVTQVKAITGGRGARLVFDPVAGKGVMQLAEATADRGTIMVAGYLGTDMFGYKDGQPTPFPFIEGISRNLNMRGYSAHELMSNVDEMRKATNYIGQRLATGEFVPRIDRVFPLDEIEKAYAHQRDGSQIGKIVIAATPSRMD